MSLSSPPRSATNGVPLCQLDGEPQPGAVLLLHGRGASAESILPLATELGRADLPALAPQAPAGAWYPHSFLAPLAANEPHLSQSLARVGSTVQHLLDSGIPQTGIALVGFSQGACLALELAARTGGRWGAVIALSGGLIGTSELANAEPTLQGMGGPFADKAFDYASSLDSTPVFIGGSDVDPHIPLARMERSAEVLRQLDAKVDLRVYPGLGHTVNADELAAGRALLEAL
ncbi:MAG: dienelactone hydrolase family protein [Rubricoccaceae bacterium]